jgi:hypothetical protein
MDPIIVSEVKWEPKLETLYARSEVGDKSHRKKASTERSMIHTRLVKAIQAENLHDEDRNGARRPRCTTYRMPQLELLRIQVRDP